MSGIIDYVNWRGDILFDQDPLNEVDLLVFSSLAYLNFSKVVSCVPGQDKITISALKKLAPVEQYLVNVNFLDPFYENLPLLLKAISRSPRFGKVKVSGFVSEFDSVRFKQFAAVVFSIDEKLHVVAYRGTDDTLVGWKEDFHLTFMDNIPSQRRAVEYLEEAAKNLNGELVLGGHSKGGNLSVYAATFCSPDTRAKIKHVYNLDGPGLKEADIKKPQYIELLPILETFVPKSSVFGVLFENGEEYRVIESIKEGLLQHDLFNWKVWRNRLIPAEGLTQNSLEFNREIKQWLELLSLEQREQFVNIGYDLIQSTGAQTLSELANKSIFHSLMMFRAFSKLDKEKRASVEIPVKLFFGSSHRFKKLQLIRSFIPKSKTEVNETVEEKEPSEGEKTKTN